MKKIIKRIAFNCPKCKAPFWLKAPEKEWMKIIPWGEPRCSKHGAWSYKCQDCIIIIKLYTELLNRIGEE